MSTASNIKDKSTQKAVLDTLKTIQQRLKKAPKSNLAVYAGHYL
jgi:peptide subunit release factor 1 (eRF1)